MTIIGIDDTDSRTYGMCTTFIGHLISERLKELGEDVNKVMLTRLNPAAKHKTRGNAAVAIHTSADPERAFKIAKEEVFPNSATEDKDTNPGVVVCQDNTVSETVSNFTFEAIHELLDIEYAEEIISDEGYLSDYLGNGRGRIGSLAAIGASEALTDFTYEYISYRELDKCNQERDVDPESLFKAANKYYPHAWDTVDRKEGDMVCVPHTPCPILFAVRGDCEESIKSLSEEIDSQPIISRQLFVTNQGTDVHLQDANSVTELENEKAYRIEGEICSEPQTKKGGRVEVNMTDGMDSITLIAFEPTKRFRDYVRSLRIGDKVTVCGEVSKDSLKLEKFAIRELNTTEKVNPECENCGINMQSAGANQGYRCRKCSNKQREKDTITIDRDLNIGWYEVPPCARRHIAKPLIRGGFNSPINPLK